MNKVMTETGAEAFTAHLQMIRQTINLYEWLSMAMKVIAILAGGAAFVLVSFGHPTPGTVALSLLASSAFVFLLWACDAHFRTTKWGFIRLFEAARKGKTEPFDMDPKPFKERGQMKRSLWAPPHAWLYLAMQCCIFILVFMR